MDRKDIGKMVGHAFESVKDVYGHVGGLDGLDRRLDTLNDKIVQNSWIKQLFGRHTPDELESLFMVGTHTTTPALQNVDAHFPKPWVFLRMLFVSVLLYFGFILLDEIYNNLRLIPAQFVIGAIAVPISVLCLFFELNVRRNVSIYRVTRFVLVGGLISFLYSLFIYAFQNKGTSIFWAGPIEELGKLLAMIVIAEGATKLKSSNLLGIIALPFDLLIGKGVAQGRQYKWTLNGLLFGAAVGVGFAAFETMGYAFDTLLVVHNGAFFQEIPKIGNEQELGQALAQALEQSRGAMRHVVFLRGILSPFSHVVWSAMCGGALWSVRGGEEWRWTKLFHIRLLLFFCMASCLHGLWDMTCSYPHWWLWLIGIGIVSWIIVFFQIRSGLKQIRNCQATELLETVPSHIRCPHCGYEYEYDPDLIGYKVQCGSCKKAFVVGWAE